MLFHNVEEYTQIRLPPVPFYIQNLLPVSGCLLLFGKPGIKKSWLAEHIGYCIATGTDWLGFRTLQTSTLLVNFELAPIVYHNRLVLMKRNFENAEGLWEYTPQDPRPTLLLDEREDFEYFKEKVDELDPNVIILDCMAQCFSGDENASKDMGKFIKNMKELKGERRGLIIVHHSNKNLLALDPMDKARGHTKLTGWVDSAIYMLEQPACYQLQFVKHRLSPVDLHSLSVVFQDYNWIPRALARRQQEEV